MRKWKSEKHQLLYGAWARMKQRCNGTSNAKDAKNYVERDISYDPAWERFENFLNDMNAGWQKGLTLDRIDNNAGYSKENCRWANRKTQAINRRNTRFFSFNGEERTLTDWSPIVKVARSTLAVRFYNYGWSIEKTLSTPLQW